MNKTLTYLLILCFSGLYINLNAQIDLELNLTTTQPNPSIYSTIPLTYIVTNTSTTTATNVKVYLSICNSEEDRPRLFLNEYGIVNASTSAVLSSGTYNTTNQIWTIPEVVAGNSETITIYAFTLTEEPRTLLGEIFSSDQTDADSSPGNLLTCTTNEDDEARFTLNGNEPFECDYDNAQWLNSIINDEETLCDECYESINIYTLEGETRIEFLGYDGCDDAFTIVYNCDGTEFCTSTSLFGGSYRPCTANFYEKNPIFIENIWSRTNCVNTNLARIQAHVWWDENGNGEKNYLDDGIGQQLVQIEDSNNNIVVEGLTEENGYISFNGLAAGTYRVIFEPINDAMATLKNVQSTLTSRDSDINPDSKTDFFTLSSTGHEQHVGAGFTTALIGNDIDLELSLSTPDINPTIFSTVPFTYTLTNTGTTTATNIEVEAGVCSPMFNNFSSFYEGNQVVNSSSPPPSIGTYNDLADTWTIPQLEAGGSATLILNLFILTQEERTILGQVTAVDQGDMDSAPTNLSACNAVEDDEVALIINGSIMPECDYQNEQWLNNLLANNPSLCSDCIAEINVYELDNVIYIGVLADNLNCSDALTTIYNCDGTIFCLNGGFEGLTECEEWWTANPTLVETLWSQIENCSIGDLTDLELSVNVANANPEIYNNVAVTYTISNTGTATATDILIGVGVCQEEGEFTTSLFYQVTGLVYGSPSPSVSMGTYAQTSQTWTIPALAPGASATLDISLFTLTTSERSLWGTVYNAIPEDVDSTPGNIFDCTPQEDDETTITLNGNTEELPDFIFSSIGFQVNIFPNAFILSDGDNVPSGVTIDMPYHGVTGSMPIPDDVYETTTRFYLSTDNMISDDDIVLKEMPNTIIGLGTMIFQAGYLGTFDISENIALGDYFLIAKIDADDEVVEENELNNLIIIPFSLVENYCNCPDLPYEPVCGSDGITYDNTCLARCEGVTYTDGECEDVCTCEATVDPVCGSNGVTYQNACLAACDGIFDYTSGECPISDGVDLELEIIVPNTYNIYTTVNFQARVFNNGTINAENVKVDFPLPEGFVHSSNSTSYGSYDLFREKWNIGTIKVGETAVLDLNLFALTSNDITAYAQVSNANPDDIDSTPNNGTCCTANEDDEATVTISSNFQNDNNTTAFVTPSEHRDIIIKTLYPNIVTEEMTIFVQSKLPELQLRVYNLQGNEVMQQKYLETEGFRRLNLNVSILPTGTYLLRFDGSLGQETTKFIKVRM